MILSSTPRPARVLAVFLAFSAVAIADEDTGATVFRNICAVCHGDEGLGQPGLYPPLAGSHFLKGDPGRSIRIVLHGLEGPVTVGGEVYNSVMPPNAEILTDEDIAAVLNHLRGRWGDGQGPVVTSDAVAAIRAETPDRATMWTISGLDALAAKPTAQPAPAPVAAVGPPGSPAPADAGPAKGALISRPAPPAHPVPWLRMILLSLPMVIFLLGVCLLPERRR
jgi:mono/diheme cytochrome c family protein